MSESTLPISPARFAAALEDLPLSTLHLKAAELRNSIAHLDYSNEQLKPFASGLASTTMNDVATPQEPDQDCIDAIKENEIVIARMEERIDLLKTEVERRGASWREFEDIREGEVGGTAPATVNGTAGAAESVGESDSASTSSPWTDGTFQTGRVVNGEVFMDTPPQTRHTGGSLTDAELTRRLAEQMADNGSDDGGMHL